MPAAREIAASLRGIARLTAKNAEMLGIVDERQKVMRDDMAELKDHQKEANGRLAVVVREQHQMDGALAMVKWMVATTLGGIGAGAALAGIILAVGSSRQPP